MKKFILATLLIGGALAEPIELSAYSTKGQHRTNKNSFHIDSYKRLPPVKVENEFYYYQLTADMGTPKQPITFLLDTGSSDVWAMASSNPFCYTGEFNCDGLVFNPEASSTFQNTSQDFKIKYADYTAANGTIIRDTLSLGGITLDNAEMALAYSSNSTPVVFGIGLPQNEATNTLDCSNSDGSCVFEHQYINTAEQIADQYNDGYSVYSFYFNNGVRAAEGNPGQIIFGGMDTKKFKGDMSIVPLINYYRQIGYNISNPVDFSIMLNGVYTKDGCDLISGFSIAALLDSGTSYGYLPDQVVESIGESIGYEYDADQGVYTGSCTNLLLDTIYLDFSGKNISVPTAQLLDYLYEDDDSTCMLAIIPSGDIRSTGGKVGNIIGDVLLRSLYVVYDLTHYELGIAQAKPNVTDSEIQPLTKSIEGATRAPRYSSVLLNGKYTKDSSCKTAATSTRPAASSVVSSSRVSSTGHNRTVSSKSIPVLGSSSTMPVTSVSTSNPIPRSKSGSISIFSSSAPASISALIPASKSSNRDPNIPTSTSGSIAESVPSHASASVSAPASLSKSEPARVSIFTTTVSSFTTFCPSSTQFTVNGGIYTASASETLTITNCPCTLTGRGSGLALSGDSSTFDVSSYSYKVPAISSVTLSLSRNGLSVSPEVVPTTYAGSRILSGEQSSEKPLSSSTSIKESNSRSSIPHIQQVTASAAAVDTNNASTRKPIYLLSWIVPLIQYLIL